MKEIVILAEKKIDGFDGDDGRDGDNFCDGGDKGEKGSNGTWKSNVCRDSSDDGGGEEKICW